MVRHPGRPPRPCPPAPSFLAFATAVVIALGFGLSASARADEPRTLVLPFRTIGVSDTTAAVFVSLLEGELENRRVPVISTGGTTPEPGSSATACDEPACASEQGRASGADRVVFGSLSRLATKVIVRVRAMDVGAAQADYTDQLTAVGEADLDAVARRVAMGIATGQPNSERATVDAITLQETETPRRRAASAGFGFRAGFVLPDGNSYGGANQLTGLRMVYHYEAENFYVETTPVLGLLWGSGSVEWTLIDVSAGRILSRGDVAPFFGAGLGVHALHVESRYEIPYTDPYNPGYPYSYTNHYSQNATALTADVGGGLLLFRTYDFAVVLDVRYHVVFSSFDDLGSHGAHGLMLSFGTSGSSKAPSQRRGRIGSYWDN